MKAKHDYMHLPVENDEDIAHLAAFGGFTEASSFSPASPS
jgi:hypothetical protein